MGKDPVVWGWYWGRTSRTGRWALPQVSEGSMRMSLPHRALVLRASWGSSRGGCSRASDAAPTQLDGVVHIPGGGRSRRAALFLWLELGKRRGKESKEKDQMKKTGEKRKTNEHTFRVHVTLCELARVSGFVARIPTAKQTFSSMRLCV